jgi:hypothetical protein
MSKYNQLLRIEEELGSTAVYLGKNFKFIKWFFLHLYFKAPEKELFLFLLYLLEY